MGYLTYFFGMAMGGLVFALYVSLYELTYVMFPIPDER